jgi:class 3 adenylate cyclase
MMESSSRTLVCSVLFLDIVEYSKKPVADQLHLKQAFNQVLANALDGVPSRDRIILDTGDGAAVTFMGDPEDALFAAMAVRDAAGSAPIRLGVNLGPVRLVKDLNGQMNIIGDGINVAQRVMSFSSPGQLLVSRSFYEVVSCLSRDYLKLFRHEGSRTDKHVREHEVYSVVGGAPDSRRVSQAASQVTQARIRTWIAGIGPLGVARSALVAAPALFFAMVGGAFAVSAMLDPSKPAATAAVATPAKAPVAVAAKTEVAAIQPAVQPAVPADNSGQKDLVASVEKKPAEKRRGKLELAITPWGTVFVDGVKRGESPPLTTLELSSGKHTVVVRNSSFPPHVEQVVIKGGGAPVKIRHRFR